MSAKTGRSVLFCTYSHNILGGIEIWQRRMLPAFRAAGWRTTLGVARGKRFNDPEIYRKAMGEDFVESFDGRTGTDEGRILAIQNVIERVPPDVVVVSGLAHAAPAVGRLKAAGVDIRFVYAIHATSSAILGDVLACAEVVDLAVGVNPLHAEFLQRHGFAGRETVIPYGTDLPSQPRYGRKNADELTLLFAGRFHQESKNVLHAVALAKALAARKVPFRLLMAGSGPDEAQLRTAIRESGLESRFELLGWIDQTQLHNDVLPRADVLLLFSPSEGNPLVLGEALAHGVVPVSTPFLGLRNLSWFREGTTALTYPFDDIDALATTLQHLEGDPSRLYDMSRACREAGLNLSWEACTKRWIASLDDLASRPPTIPRGDFPLRRPAHAGRLDAIGVGPKTAEAIRRMFRRFPDFPDGWGEWPGTLGLTTNAEAERILNELRTLDGSRHA